MAAQVAVTEHLARRDSIGTVSAAEITPQLTHATTIVTQKSDLSGTIHCPLVIKNAIPPIIPDGGKYVVGNFCESPTNVVSAIRLQRDDEDYESVIEARQLLFETERSRSASFISDYHSHPSVVANPPAHNEASAPANVSDSDDESDLSEEESASPWSTRPRFLRHESYDGRRGKLQDDLQKEIDQYTMGDDAVRSGFIPRGVVEGIIYPAAVEEQLRHVESAKSKSLNWLVEKLRPFGSSEDAPIARQARKICGSVHSTRSDPVLPPKQYQMIFGVLMLVGKPGRISRFVDEQVCDDDLPLVKHDKQKKLKPWTLVRKSKPEKLRCFKGWKMQTIRSFEEKQWHFTAPFFKTWNRLQDLRPFQFHESAILPYTSWKQICRSGFSDVFEVKLHPSQHNLCSEADKQNTSFALKRVDKNRHHDCLNELRILKRAGAKRHRHLITLLSAYEYGEHFYFLFPLARCDLRDFWKTTMPRPAFSQQLVKWMARQCKGLAGALARISRHETSSGSSMLMHLQSLPAAKKDEDDVDLPRESRSFQSKSEKSHRKSPKKPSRGHRVLFGRHGDIKPENILYFQGEEDESMQGTLKIGDFGTAELSVRQETSNSQVTSLSPTYRPPECDLPGDKVVNSLWDVWSLGCLYLEFVTWLLLGFGGIEEFYTRRLSYNETWGMESDEFFEATDSPGRGKSPMRLKESVKQWIERLHCDEKACEFLHEFLNMIELDMLEVNLPVLHNRRRKRLARRTADQVWEKMKEFCKLLGDKNGEYATAPCSWQPSRS